MNRSGAGEKRGTDAGPQNEGLKFIPGLTLSQHPFAQRKDLFMKKFNDLIRSKSLHPTEFEGYTIRERFQKMGWEQLLNLSCDKIYKRVVVQWVASLSRNGDELTGVVDGKSYTITPAIIRDVLGVDTRTDVPYARFKIADFLLDIEENKRRRVEAFKTVFGMEENAKKKNLGYMKSKMTPLLQVLWEIGVCTFHPRLVDVFVSEIYLHEIYLLHALFTGDYLYSFAHLMIDDIWNMYEHEHRRNIPHACYISKILDRLGAVSGDEYVVIIPPHHRSITRSLFLDEYDFVFSETSKEYIIDDTENLQRVTFRKKVIAREAPPKFHTNTIPSQRYVPNPQQSQTSKQSSPSEKEHSEMMTILTNIQNKIERQELEAERRERQAEIRSHAIIWNIERQRYFYEQEQEQLHKAWNEAYGSDVFQFPQVSHTSFHPLQVGSQYYDPDQGDAIPKAFQDFFHDIYGTRR